MNSMAGAPKGNQNAVKDNRIWGNAIRKAVMQRNGDKLRTLADKLIDRAAEGDIAAMKELGDRLDGRPAQTTIVQGDNDKPLVSRIEVALVNNKG